MPTAVWNNRVIAQSDRVETVEGNAYFPAAAVKPEYLRASDTTSVCSWKGTASYYTLVVDGRENIDAAWVYREPSAAAANIKDMIAFWHGVEVKP
ncbi:MAG TPA: DUF427 domain-containing protein [Dongiaceae bacterium]